MDYYIALTFFTAGLLFGYCIGWKLHQRKAYKALGLGKYKYDRAG